jgi:hypothetical protein
LQELPQKEKLIMKIAIKKAVLFVIAYCCGAFLGGADFPFWVFLPIWMMFWIPFVWLASTWFEERTEG